MKRLVLLVSLLFTINLLAADLKARNVFLLTVDGLRWQEVFRGLDESLASNTEYNKRSKDIKALYWTDSKEERAQSLMPFLHGTVVQKGTVVGNRDKNSCARVANPWYFSTRVIVKF